MFTSLDVWLKTATDLEKKMTKLAASLVVNKIKEDIKEGEEEAGIGAITLMAGARSNINGVRDLKYVQVIFHSGQRLFLTVDGKGKKGLMVEDEWLSTEELEDMVVAATGADAEYETGLEDFMMKRGMQSLSYKDFILPMQCEAEGNSRCVWVSL